jgi:solute:Na+ symporter, SSS family
LVAQILPHGIRGFVACGMIVALMASLASKFNASATLFTMDFYREWRPKASGREEVTVGRIATGAIVVLGICWVLVIKQLSSNLYEYLQNVQSYLSPAIVVLFIAGVFWKRATAPAAFWSFLVGIIGGFARLVADIVMKGHKAEVAALKQQLFHNTITVDQYHAALAPLKAQYGVIFDIWIINWLYWCQTLLVTSAVLMVVISLLTKAPAQAKLKYSWFGATPEEKAATRASWGVWDVILSLTVVAIIVAFYIVFF